MNYNTVYVGMDVHKESFTLCSCKYEDEKASHYQRTPASYKNVLRYLAFLRTIYGEDTRFVCGYESVSKGTGTDQRFVKNALKNAELPP